MSGSAAVATPAAGSSAATAHATARTATNLEVYAAASLKAALARAAAAYTATHPDVWIATSTDSSTALATKIEQGAPADVFLSADMKNPQALVDQGLAAGGVVTFARNQLTVIVPAANPAGITAPTDLARPGVKIIAAADGVPIQVYTAAWLAKVGALPGYGPGFAAGYAANVVSREDNAGAIVAKVGLGEGDAAIVYVSDALGSDKVRPIAIPADQNVQATYGGVVVNASTHPGDASAFLAWLAGAEGQAILASFGFLPAAP